MKLTEILLTLVIVIVGVIVSKYVLDAISKAGAQ
jgi:hypothetical protein